jgi:hypothetical protein
LSDSVEERTPKYSKNDILVYEPPDGFDADPYPVIIIEVLDETAGDSKGRLSDGEVATYSEIHRVPDNDPLYRTHDLVIVDGEFEKGYQEGQLPEGSLRLIEEKGHA